LIALEAMSHLPSPPKPIPRSLREIPHFLVHARVLEWLAAGKSTSEAILHLIADGMEDSEAEKVTFHVALLMGEARRRKAFLFMAAAIPCFVLCFLVQLFVGGFFFLDSFPDAEEPGPAWHALSWLRNGTASSLLIIGFVHLARASRMIAAVPKGTPLPTQPVRYDY
jgi:hypothetical protein